MEMNELYALKYANFQKAVNREEGAYVPTTMINNGGGFSGLEKQLWTLKMTGKVMQMRLRNLSEKCGWTETC